MCLKYNVVLKELFSQIIQFCHHLLTLMSFQTCMTFFFWWGIVEDISQNVQGALADDGDWSCRDTTIIHKTLLYYTDYNSITLLYYTYIIFIVFLSHAFILFYYYIYCIIKLILSFVLLCFLLS